MKKSEALEKIYKKLDILGVPDLSKHDCVSLLTFFEEELGMLPPERKVFVSEMEIEKVVKRHFDKNRFLHIWESEDE